ncbi:MAG: 2-dehydropantoate 2-reductase [Oscillospiraceae bacterium]|nr:2-dehydropantoate 2-reductase [Oscillospiraceae bacterium]
MNIAILGSGAMGCLFGSYLSKRNNVFLIGHNSEKQAFLDKNGIIVRERDGREDQYYPHAVSDCAALPVADLLIVFVRVMDTLAALESNKSIIGPDTYVLTLQNGAGHDEKLLKYVDSSHAIIGSTKHSSCVVNPGLIFHSGIGKTAVGAINRDSDITFISDELTACGFPCVVSESIKKQIWDKLFVNTAASSLTGVLQVPLGFILDDPYANSLMRKMIHEAVEVAKADGFDCFDEDQVTKSVIEVIENGKNGYTSIYTHVKTGQKSEVDYISGYVLKRAKELGIPAPCHEMVVTLIHALENRNSQNIC